jgi:hypothetical protein
VTLGILRRQPPASDADARGSAAAPAARELGPRPGAEQRIEELDELEALKEAGVLSEAEFNRQRNALLAGLV